MVGGLLLALISAALINIGFLLQHRGLSRGSAGDAMARLRQAVRDRSWLGGQALGWIGFGAQTVAVVIAPLSLVQAFAAGGLALSVPVAAGIFRHRVGRRQMLAVLAIAAGLAALPLGFSTARDRLGTEPLILAVVVCGLAGVAIVRVRRRWTAAVAAGVFYGVADAAIKAISLDWQAHGAAALLSGWTAVAAAGTFAGFLAFQSALQGSAVAAISLMNALAALVALGCGVLAFAESLGAGAPITVAHALAIAVVLCGVPVLAAAQAEIVESADARQEGPAPLPASVAAVQGPR
jgi:drug/metabolite transporter (DMT)-like permease